MNTAVRKSFHSLDSNVKDQYHAVNFQVMEIKQSHPVSENAY